MRTLFLLAFFYTSLVFSFDLQPMSSGALVIEGLEGHGEIYHHLTISDDGEQVTIRDISFKDNISFSHRDWMCINNLGKFYCKSSEIYKTSNDFIKIFFDSDVGACKQSIDKTDFIAHDADVNFYVLENRKDKFLLSLDKKTCDINPIASKSKQKNPKKKFQQDFGSYIGTNNGIVYYYYESKDVYGVLGVGQYDLYQRLNRADDEVFGSNRFWLDFGLVDFSKNGVLAVVKTVERDVPKEKLDEMDAYRYYVCFYVQDNLKLSKESCHDIIPLDKQNNSILIDSLAISDNGKYFALMYENENHEYEIRSYWLKK